MGKSSDPETATLVFFCLLSEVQGLTQEPQQQAVVSVAKVGGHWEIVLVTSSLEKGGNKWFFRRWQPPNWSLSLSVLHVFMSKSRKRGRSRRRCREVGELLGLLDYFSCLITVKKTSVYHNTACMICNIEYTYI